MRQFLAKQNHLYGQLLLLFALDLLSGFILYGKPLAQGRLYWDMLDLFSIFRDNLNSLNYFGEIAWWNPNIRHGFPLYYISILGHSIYNPVFFALAAICWVLGLMNIHISSFLSVYSIYIVFIIPFFFSLGGLLLARQIFRSNITITLILVLAGFSPGIILNLGDEGLLLTAWSLFFAAAFLRFIKAPSLTRFWSLCLAMLVIALAFNHIALHWSVLFLPLFCIACLFISPVPVQTLVRSIVSAVPKWSWAVAGVALIIGLLPTAITYLHGSELVRTKMGARWYPLEMLRPGNPLESLTISTPAIGFDWLNNAVWRPFSFLDMPQHASGDYLAYTYLGLLALPLAITGLAYGRRTWRLRLLALIGISALVIVLSGYSPLFYLIMFWEQPLRAVNHYSDMFFRLGIFYLLILAAGLGFEMLIRGGNPIKRQFLIIYGLSTAWSLSLLLGLYGKNLLDTPMFGFAVLCAVFYLIILMTMMRGRSKGTPHLTYFLIALMALDIATVATWHVRHFAWKIDPGKPAYYERTPGTVGLPPDDPGNYTVQVLLEVRQIKEQLDAGIDLQSVPRLGTFSVQENGSITGLHTDAVRLLQQTYNTATIEAMADGQRYLFWRDAHFPGWKATVNGQPVEIRNFNGFKAVPILPGRSEVRFLFSPGALPYALLLAYGVFAAVFLLWLWSRRTERLSEESR